MKMNQKLFESACNVAGIKVTDRQVSKFRNGHGAAYRMQAYLGEHGIRGWNANIIAGAFNQDELNMLRRNAMNA
jgi:hypothetical protein